MTFTEVAMVGLIVGLIILFLVLVYLVVAYFIASNTVHLNRQPVPKNPGDYGLDYENIEFKAADGVKIKGWLTRFITQNHHHNACRRTDQIRFERYLLSGKAGWMEFYPDEGTITFIVVIEDNILGACSRQHEDYLRLVEGGA
jgi:hypothetical protein